ncbi:MAG: FixH family protein [Hyphomicrobiales bacterium]|nr:FixH family protein [Hyphomicrobiales bacterium]
MPTVLPTAEDVAREKAKDGFRLTGLHVLLMLVAFFVTVASVNAIMIHDALSTFRGEVTKHPYEEGLAYNSDIQEARAQAARGWKVAGDVVRDANGQARVEVSALDSSGAPLVGLSIAARLAAPADMKRDRLLTLEDAGNGVYRGSVAADAGAWYLELVAGREGKTLFQSRNRITLK